MPACLCPMAGPTLHTHLCLGGAIHNAVEGVLRARQVDAVNQRVVAQELAHLHAAKNMCVRGGGRAARLGPLAVKARGCSECSRVAQQSSAGPSVRLTQAQESGGGHQSTMSDQSSENHESSLITEP